MGAGYEEEFCPLGRDGGCGCDGAQCRESGKVEASEAHGREFARLGMKKRRNRSGRGFSLFLMTYRRLLSKEYRRILCCVGPELRMWSWNECACNWSKSLKYKWAIIQKEREGNRRLK